MRTIRWSEYGELAALFLIQSMAVGIWMVPLSVVFKAHLLEGIAPYAFATSALAALVSPLIFGAMADRHASPVAVLRGLAVASAATMSVVAWSINRGWSPGLVLLLVQIYALCAAPTGSIVSAIVFSRLQDSQRQFGPIRAGATVGWMAGCWLVSALNADASTLSEYTCAATWLALAAFTFLLPSVPPPKSTGHPTLLERLGWDAVVLLKNRDHRAVFITAALFSIPLAAFYPFTPLQLQQLGFRHTSAWMTLAQTTELMAMFSLAGLFLRWRLKWIFVAGLVAGLLRFALCAVNGKVWVLAGTSLHGLSFTLYFITAQIYINERVGPEWRARAQAMLALMINGVGNLFGYLGTGWWFKACAQGAGTQWQLFWSGVTMAVGVVMIYFLAAYHGKYSGTTRLPSDSSVIKPTFPLGETP
ncbi:MAG: MFS transporter [Verrucomicrobiota bacterium]